MLLATKITPVLRYRDPGTAAQWLCRAFGFSEHETLRGANGDVTYVLLQLGPNFVLVLPVADLGLDELLVQPQAVGGANTQVCYVTVRDAKAHSAQAERAGAKIVIEPQDDGLGGQFYTCSDLEGHLWSFGTRAYGLADDDARQLGADDPGLAQADTTVRSGRRSGGRVLARSLAVAAAMALTAAGGWVAHQTYVRVDTASAARVDGALEQLAQERKRLAAAEDAAKDAEEKLAEQRSSAGEIRRALQQALAELTAERQRKGEAAAALAASKGAATELEQGKLRAQTELAAAREKIAQEKALAKSAAERVGALQAQIDKLQQDRVGEREDLSKAKAALLGAQAEVKALREAKVEPKAPPVSPPPAAVQAQEEAEKLAAALAAVMPQAGAAEPATAKVSVPDPPAAKTAPPKGACAAAVEGKWKSAGTWGARLCQGAESSQEPVRCFEELMRGKVSWGTGTAWTAPHALTLCSGSRNAQKTLDCFSGKITAEEPWQTAIQGCRAN
jgi:uncharacterized glyoxalase superfamily protein PhnB